jgi:hypothetical protein
MVDKKNELLSGGGRDIEQIASLTTTNDVLGGVLLHHPFFSSVTESLLISTLPMLASRLNRLRI